jgi:hypothetical protein
MAEGIRSWREEWREHTFAVERLVDETIVYRDPEEAFRAANLST